MAQCYLNKNKSQWKIRTRRRKIKNKMTTKKIKVKIKRNLLRKLTRMRIK